ncbi:MAG: hypothetical protein M3Y05_09310 [Gemmatimonadota bacterium]|nr:hypothetical protein [Gemmatimonadota bacterium]
MFSRTWKLEGSIFNGREPDEHRTNIETGKLDSYAARFFYNPDTSWSYSASAAYIASPEVLHPDESLHRYSASIMNTRLLGERGEWSTTLIYGANAVEGAALANSALIESDFSIDAIDTFFGRAELVQKSAQDLVVADQSESRRYDIGALTLGYSREIMRARGLTLGVSILGTLNAVPTSLESTYGTRFPKGYAVFLRLRPDRMHTRHVMAGM